MNGRASDASLGAKPQYGLHAACMPDITRAVSGVPRRRGSAGICNGRLVVVGMHDMQIAGRVAQCDTALFLCVLPSWVAKW